MVAFVYNYRRGRQQGPLGQRSTINRATGYLWGSIGAAFGITTALMFQPGMGFHPAYVFYICLFGIGTVGPRAASSGFGRWWWGLPCASRWPPRPSLSRGRRYVLVLALALVVSYISSGSLAARRRAP
ncbi:MAG: hypothetical protein WKG07_02940 [Hymenobacter sp.]